MRSYSVASEGYFSGIERLRIAEHRAGWPMLSPGFGEGRVAHASRPFLSDTQSQFANHKSPELPRGQRGLSLRSRQFGNHGPNPPQRCLKFFRFVAHRDAQMILGRVAHSFARCWRREGIRNHKSQFANHNSQISRATSRPKGSLVALETIRRPRPQSVPARS